jgi:hypothetical protein
MLLEKLKAGNLLKRVSSKDGLKLINNIFFFFLSSIVPGGLL